MKKINSRQLIIFYFIYSFAIKFLRLPHYLAGAAASDVWIAAGIGTIIELLCLWLVLCVLSKDSEKDIYDGLRFGRSGVGTSIFAKAVISVMFVFFLVQTMITLTHTNYLLSHTLYEKLDVHLFIIPILVLGVFFCYSKTRAVFRSGEIFYVLILIAIFLAVLPAFWKIDVREGLPVFTQGLKPVLRAVYDNLIYFEGAAILLMFKGEIEIRRAFTRNFMISAAIGAVVFFAFVFFYYSLFGPLAEIRTLGIVDITGNNSYIAQNGRLEWIIVCVWLLLLLMRFGVLFYSCFATARFITHVRFQPAAIAFPLAAVIYAGFLFITNLDEILASLRPFILGFYVLVPLLFLTAVVISKSSGKQRAQKGGKNV